MASLNKVMLIGNAGKDAELRYMSSGTAKSEFSLAVNSRRRSQSGDWEEQTEWFNIVLWAEQAERVSQYITKGKQVYIEGRLQTRSWDNDQGVKQYRTEVIAQTVQLLGGPRDSDGGGRPSSEGWGDGSQSFAGSRSGGGDAQRGGGGGYSGPRGNQGGDMDPDDLPFE